MSLLKSTVTVGADRFAGGGLVSPRPPQLRIITHNAAQADGSIALCNPALPFLTSQSFICLCRHCVFLYFVGFSFILVLNKKIENSAFYLFPFFPPQLIL